jgi:hypothetical protein
VTWAGTIMLGGGALSALISVSEIVRLWRLNSLSDLSTEAEDEIRDIEGSAWGFGIVGAALLTAAWVAA